MSDWINIFDVESTLGYKLLIAGLKEAGKTAVKRIFFLKQQAVDVENLKATINYERMAVKVSGIPITVVDLGGQRIFIKRFLDKFSPFIFNGVKLLIFLIDVSEKSTRYNAIQYFKSCVEKLDKYSIEAEIYVFLHKKDLIKDMPNYESILSQLKEQFQVESPRSIKFFTTSIFDPESVINAFGRIFELSIPSAAKNKLVDGRLIGPVEEHAEKFAVLNADSVLCPNCNIPLFETHEGLKCSICDHLIPIQKDEPVKKKKSKEDLVAKLHSQLGEIILEQNEGQPINLPNVQSVSSEPDNQLNRNRPEGKPLSYFDDFSAEEQQQIHKSGFFEIIDLCQKLKINSGFIHRIFFSVLPKLGSNQDKLSKNILFGVISAYANGVIKEDEIYILLEKSIYFPNLSVDELIWNTFPVKERSDRRTDQQTQILEDLEEKILAEDIESKYKQLSKSEKIFFKLIPMDYNVELDLYDSHSKIETITIAYDISDIDLTYLFAYELKLRIKSDMKEFVKTSVQTILTDLKALRHDFVSEKINKEKLEAVKLHDNYPISYSITIEGDSFSVTFKRNENSFGEIANKIPITAPELYKLVRDNTLISTIIPEDDLMLAILDLYKKFDTLLKSIEK